MVDKKDIPFVKMGNDKAYKQEHADAYIGNTDYRSKVQAVKTLANTYYFAKHLDHYLKNTH